MATTLKDNTSKSQFEIEVEGHTVFARYQLEANHLHILHVESPEALRGKGAAGQLMLALMEHARAKGLKVTPVCGYAVSWIKRNGTFGDILA